MRFPEKCPYCGKDNVENEIIHQSEQVLSNTKYGVALHLCVHCRKPIFVYQNEVWGNETMVYSQVVHYFPYSDKVEYPEKVQKLSPKAYETFKQTLKAKDMGLESLVGAGLRISLEHLVWDYLINIKNMLPADIEKLSLSKRIELMNVGFYTKVCLRLIRLFGNDHVHIIKMLDFSIEETIEAYKTLCNLIESEITILENNERLPS